MIQGKEKTLRDVRPGLSYSPGRLFMYRAMIESIFRSEGPSKSKVQLTEEEGHPQPISAGIEPSTWDASFTVRQGMSFKDSRQLVRFLDAMNIEDAVGETLHDVAIHEIGHWEFPKLSGFGCPFDRATYYTSFVEPIYEELERSGKFPQESLDALSMDLANAVTDIIDNYNNAASLSERRQGYSGQTLFWYLAGQEAGKYSAEYTLFVKLNLALFGNQHDLALLKKFMHESNEVGKSVKKLAAFFSPVRTPGEARLSNGKPKDFPLPDEVSASPLLFRENWEKLARAYAREAIKFIDPPGRQPKMPYSAGSGQAGQPPGGGGQAQQGGKSGEKDGEEDEPGKGQGEAKKPGSDLTKADKEKIMGGRKAGQGVPFFLDPTEALDAYYSALTRRMLIKAAGKMPSAHMPLIQLTHEAFDPDVHDASDLSMRLVMDRSRGTISRSVAKMRMPIDIPIKKEKRNLPDFVMALIDSSGSMMGGGDKAIVPWGDASYYHYAILTYYGILRFFETEHILHKMGVSAAIFSDETLAASGIDEVKRLILNPMSGGTRLDVQKVMESVRGKKDVLFSMISDGDIVNWGSIKDEFIALAKANQFFMIQIGSPGLASGDIQASGLAVHYVTGHKDIVKLAIDLTVQRYRASIASGVANEAKKYGRG